MYYLVFESEIIAEIEAASLSEAFQQVDNETWERYQNIWFGSQEEAKRLGLI